MLSNHLYFKAIFYIFLYVMWGSSAKEKGGLVLVELLARCLFIYCQEMLKMAALFRGCLTKDDIVVNKE